MQLSRHAARALTGNDRTSFYDEIASKIIGELVVGRVFCVNPRGMAAAKAPLAMPKNAATSRCYSGIECRRRGRLPAQRWVTFRQALSLGANVRKGEAQLFGVNQSPDAGRVGFEAASFVLCHETTGGFWPFC